MMKRFAVLLLAMLMSMSVGLTSCKKSDIDSGSDSVVEIPVTVTVNFDKNGGEGTASMRTVTVGKTYGALPAALTRTGFTFGGWWSDSEANGWGTEITAETVVTKDENHTLYARWTAVGMTVTFNAAGGVVVPETANVVYDGVYSAPVPTRDGYTFGGWWTEADGEGTQITETTKVSQTENHEIYAKWTANTYNVAFDVGDGDWTGAPVTDKTVTFGAQYGALPAETDLELENYIFGGWYKESAHSNKVFSTDTVTYTAENGATHTLYAKWIAFGDAFKINFETGNGDALEPLYIEEGAAYGILPVLTKTGYLFGGWWTEANGGGTEVTAASVAGAGGGNTTIYAKWIAGQTAVTLNLNYGDTPETLDPVTATFGAAMPKVNYNNELVRTGYDFLGFFDDAAGTGKKYYDGNMTSAADWDKEDSVFTLYAKWALKTTVVTLDPNGGTTAAASVTATWGQPMPVAEAPSRVGYFFVGYYDSADWTQGAKYYNANPKNANMASEKDWDKEDSAVTLYARWIDTLTFDDALHLDYFSNNAGGEFTFSVTNRSNDESVDNWLTVTSETPKGFELKLDVFAAAGDVVQFDLDFVRTGSNTNLIYRHSNAAGDKIADSFRPTLYTWDGRARKYNNDDLRLSATGLTDKAAWPMGGVKVNRVMPVSGNLALAIVFDGSGIDMSDFICYIDNVIVIPKNAQYQVSFDKNGGEGTADPINVTFNTAYGTLPEVTPGNSNYVFGGWWTLNGIDTGEWGTHVTSSTIMKSAGNHTLYARWLDKGSVDSYKVSFNANGGTGEAASITVYKGFLYGELPELVKSGNVFKGWWTLDGSLTGKWGMQVEPETVANIDGDQTLHARWFDTEKKSIDFSNPNDVDYFKTNQPQNFCEVEYQTVDRSKDGSGDYWLEAKISGKGSANRALLALALNLNLRKGQVLTFDLDVVSTNALKVTNTQNSNASFPTDGLRITADMNDGWAHEWNATSVASVGNLWPAGGARITYIAWATAATNTFYMNVQVHNDTDLNDFAVYIKNLEIKDSMDFDNSSQARYFAGSGMETYGTPVFETVDRSSDNSGDNWLKITSPNAIKKPEAYYISFTLTGFTVSSGKTISFDLDFEYTSALTGASSNDVAATANSIRAEVSLTNNWKGAWRNSAGSWPDGGVKVSYIPAADGTLLFMLRINPEIDMTKFALYIDNFVVV